MITFVNGVFHIKSGDISYMFCVDRYGHLEHIHFGVEIFDDDFFALRCKPGISWGSSILYDDSNSSSCLDSIPLEWSSSGVGDYRESPVEAFVDGKPAFLDFRYVGYKISEVQKPMNCGLPQADGKTETLEVTLKDDHYQIELVMLWSAYDGIISRRNILKNNSDSVINIRKLMSFCLDIPGEYQLSTFNGGWISETHMNTVHIGATKCVNESNTGFSSNRHNPGFIISELSCNEFFGKAYGFNILYSGNHYASAQQSSQNITRVMQGISPDNFNWELSVGCDFETPEEILYFSNNGYNGLSQRMHSFINTHIIPKYWRFRKRPVLYNSWEGCMFDFDEGKLLSLAKKAKKLGCELFVLDDGWFGNRNNDLSGLGDYYVNCKKLPNGIDGLCKKINSIGLDFGLWFEPEAVNPDSDLFRKHPEWVLRNNVNESHLGRHEFLLDLTNTDVRDYIVESVSTVLDSCNITYVKWDMNRHSEALGEKAHKYILGLYDVLHRIFDSRPEILLESCSSGGNRFDLGMLCFSPQIWASDNTDPIERLDIQKGLSYLYPQSAMGNHVSASPHAQTLRNTPLPTRGNVSFFGCLGYELDLKYLSIAEEREIRSQIEFYKSHRNTFQYGKFYRLKSCGDMEKWQVSFGHENIVGVFNRLCKAGQGYDIISACELHSEKKYKLASRQQQLSISTFGGLINYISPVKLNPNGVLINKINGIVSIKDARDSFSASGAAIMSGFKPFSSFHGTGYDTNIHMHGDFGSNIYVISEDF